MEFFELMKIASNDVGLEFTELQYEQFIKYMRLLQEWNEKINLTAITEDEEVVKKHFIDCIKAFKSEQIKSAKTIIDVGTGSGAIAISLSKELDTHIYASDISETVLEVAKKNSINNNADITFYNGDMLKPYIENNIKVDIIVSNPPYIKEDEQIESIVYNNEPHLALYAKDNGLEFYESILKDASKILNDKYLIAFEIGETQGLEVRELALKYMKNAKVEIKKDLSLKTRMVFVYN